MQRLPNTFNSCDSNEEDLKAKIGQRQDSLKFYKDWEKVGAETLTALDLIETIEIDQRLQKKVIRIFVVKVSYQL